MEAEVEGVSSDGTELFSSDGTEVFSRTLTSCTTMGVVAVRGPKREDGPPDVFLALFLLLLLSLAMGAMALMREW